MKNCYKRALLKKQRQDIVRKGCLDYLSIEKIQQKLTESGSVNQYGKPWDLNTISKDIKAVEAEIYKETLAEVESRRTQLWLELQKIKKEMWEMFYLNKGNMYSMACMKIIMEAHKNERDMLGLDVRRDEEASQKVPEISFVIKGD